MYVHLCYESQLGSQTQLQFLPTPSYQRCKKLTNASQSHPNLRISQLQLETVEFLDTSHTIHDPSKWLCATTGFDPICYAIQVTWHSFKFIFCIKTTLIPMSDWFKKKKKRSNRVYYSGIQESCHMYYKSSPAGLEPCPALRSSWEPSLRVY